MNALVTAVLYAGVVVLVPLLVVLPLLLLERSRDDGRSLPNRAAGSGFPRTSDERSRGSDDGAGDAVACRTCGALNGAEYTFCHECTDRLGGR
ncbi:DUF7577 domain-containing protein [Halostella litorea]|uniref:DUF7577 domain-containing protein n=1 Tax=Halostella litorea TaxID=2528831 RepID=UPI001092F79F|nr:hypothetical protein [Halostella litorea]